MHSFGDDVFEATSVCMLHEPGVLRGSSVRADVAEGARILSDGDVFVMNSSGATVAKYNLGWPHIEEPTADSVMRDAGQASSTA
jgi:hypothetical protein